MKLGEIELRESHYVGALAAMAYLSTNLRAALLRSTLVAGAAGIYMTYEADLAGCEGWKERVCDYTQPFASGAFLVSLLGAVIGLAQLPFQDWACGGASPRGVRLFYGIGCGSVICWAESTWPAPPQDEEEHSDVEEPKSPSPPSPNYRGTPLRRAISAWRPGTKGAEAPQPKRPTARELFPE